MTAWIDWILAGMGLEALGLSAYHRLTGRGPAAAGMLPNLAAGAMLLLGLRLALSGAGRGWIAAALAAALAGHLTDLRHRWPR